MIGSMRTLASLIQAFIGLVCSVTRLRLPDIYADVMKGKSIELVTREAVKVDVEQGT